MTNSFISEQRNELKKQMRGIIDTAESEKRGLTRSEENQFNELEEKARGLERLERGKFELMNSTGRKTEKRAAKMIGENILHQMSQAAGKQMRDLKSGDVTGVLQDPDVQQEIIQQLISYMPFSQLGADMRVGQNQRNFARFPKVDALPGVSWVSTEGSGLSDDTSYTWGYVDLDFYTLATDVIKVSFELMEDSEIDMAQQVGDDILRAIANEVTRRVVDGATGSGQPDGILEQNGILTIPAGGSNLATIGTRDVFVDAIEGLLNRNVPIERIGMLMSPEAGAQWMKTLATDNNPLESPQWIRSIVEGGRLQFTTGVKNTFGGGSETRIIIGDFSNLVIRGKQTAITLRERYADNLQFGFIGYSRWSWAVKRPDFAVITGLEEQTTT
jgi:HK97 family phage major capsid protein